MLCELSYGSWLPAYASLLGIAEEDSAALLGSFFWAMFTAGRLLGIVVSRRVSALNMVTMDLCGGLLALVLVVGAGSGAGAGTALWIGSALYGLS